MRLLFVAKTCLRPKRDATEASASHDAYSFTNGMMSPLVHVASDDFQAFTMRGLPIVLDARKKLMATLMAMGHQTPPLPTRNKTVHHGSTVHPFDWPARPSSSVEGPPSWKVLSLLSELQVSMSRNLSKLKPPNLKSQRNLGSEQCEKEWEHLALALHQRVQGLSHSHSRNPANA